MSAHPDQPYPCTGNIPSPEVLEPLVNLTYMSTEAAAGLLLRGTADPVRELDEYTPALGAIEVHNAAHRQFAHQFGQLCCRILHLPTALTLSVRLEGDGGDGVKLPFALMGGSSSNVWMGRHDGRVVALKDFRLPPPHDEKALVRAKRILWADVVLWKRLSHENVLPFHGVDTTRHHRPAFVYSWAENLDIQKYLKANPGVPRPDLLFQVAKGLQYLHSVDIVHGTLKAADVLINGSGGIWIADYGLFQYRRACNCLGFNTRWDAPEVLHTAVALRPADIFAFGMLVVEVFTGREPFERLRNEPAACLRISSGKRPEKPMDVQGFGFSDAIWDLVQRCWAQDPDERPTIDDVVETWERSVNSPGSESNPPLGDGGSKRSTLEWKGFDPLSYSDSEGGSELLGEPSVA